MVYVISKNGNPLMPTERHGKVKWLLRTGKAKVVKQTPFTIQLLYDTTEYTQDITLGIDPGYKNIGISAVTGTKEVFGAEARARTDIPKLLTTRKIHRRNRRYRKTRYRKPRFSNRTKPKGWFPPSVENRIQFHIKLIRLICSILPIKDIMMEIAQFDTQKLKDPRISGKEYQQGDQLGFYNVREYVLYRDNHTCQHCKGKSKDPILQVHHLESRQTGSNRPGNLLTLCKTCHQRYHLEGFELPKPSKGYKASSQLNTMRKELWKRVKALGLPVGGCYGFQTKYCRISHGLEKSHANDAFVIASGYDQSRIEKRIQFRQIRKQNRKLCRGIRSQIRIRRNKLIFGFQLWDRVRYKGQQYFINSRSSIGFFALSSIFGEKAVLENRKSNVVKYTKLILVEKASTLLSECIV